MFRSATTPAVESYEGDITKSQLREIYEIGARNLKVNPGVTRIGRKGLSKFQAEQVFIIDQLAKKYGLEVVLVDNRLTDGDGRGVNGFYQSGTNRIVLSLQTDMNLLMVVAGHEMFHFLKNQNAAYGKHFQNVVIGELKSDSKYDFEKIYAEVSAQYEGLSEDDIFDEITAQYLGVALSDETVVQKIVNEADTKERTFLQNLIDHLKQFLSDIKSLLKLYASEDATVKAAMESPVEELQEIARQFDAALEQVAKEKNPTVSDGGVKESAIKFSKSKGFESQVRSVLDNTFDKENTHVFVADTPAVLQELGIKDRPMLITVNHIYSITVSEEQAKEDGRYKKKTNYHNLGIDVVSQLPEAIANPVAIVKSNNDSSDSDIVIITTLVAEAGKPVIVAVKIDGYGNYNGLEVDTNLIKSAYGKDNFSRYIKEAITENRFLYFNKKRSQELMNPPGVQFPDNLQTLDFSDNIAQYKQIVNKQYMQKGKKYSYAGVKAKTADIKTFDYAARLEDVGKASPEEIRQQTGWFRGYDNKWRFEISDRDMQIDTRGLFSMNPDVRRYTQLVDKAYFDMTATEEELQELVALEKNLEGVSVEPKTLGELIHHPALFEAYPQLKDIKVCFDDIEPRGAYNPVFNEITLQKKLKLDKNQLTKTLVHEIQHAVQHIEGFASGASASYWAEFYKEDYEDLKNMRENLKLWLNDIKYFDYVKASMQEVTSKKKTLEQHWKDIESFKKNSKYAREIENCEKTISELEEKLPSPDALYERTAGEIEARDAALRHWRTDEARKEKRPDIDRTDVVFADGELLSFDIKTDTEGNKFVEVNPELFDARDGESHAKTIARIIKDRFNNLISVNGQQIQINKTTNDEWRRSNGADALKHRDSQGYFDKLKTIPYADEILEAAKNWIGEELHHPRKDDIVEFARGNIYYRVGNNGYVADVIVAIRKNGAAVLYDLDDIRTKKITDVSLTMASESPQRSAETSVTGNITQDDIKVKKDFSRQRIGDAWEDIRTKMYENEVHEEIIGEIEDHIKSIKKKKLTRETIITDGLIPKYDKIFEVARSYTRGSKVKTYELANAIHEMMWAAYDGNLDTNQFIATVKLFAEDVLRTGKNVNDDMYRQYEEFRKMTREETVHVSQEVYDQYIEEYGSIKNLNRACAGKIKIKPYDNTNRSGRALDDFYGELQELYPEMFKDDVDIYHQLNEILAVWSRIQPTVEYFTDKYGIKTEADIQSQALEMAEDILADVMGIKEKVKTLADRYHAKAVRNLNYYRVREAEGRRNRREAEERALLNKRITRNTNRLSDMIRNETDQRHIPEAFKGPVMEFLNMVRLVNATGREVLYTGGTLNMVKLERAYMEYYNPKTEGGETAPKYQYDEDVVEWIKDLETAFGENADIKKMSLENLEKVDKIVSHFSHIIKHENDIFINGRREKFVSLANASIKEMYNHVRKPEYKAQKKLLDVEHGMLTPVYFFKLIGTTTENGHVNKEVLYKMFKDLQDGQDKWYRNIERVQSDLADIKNKHHYSEAWKRDTTEFSLDSGEKIKLTPEEIMYMRALYIRETKHINNLSHLTEGGVIVENDGKLKSYAEKKAAINETREARKQFDGKKSFSQADIVEGLKKNLTTEDLSKIFASLTDDMLGYSDAVVRMLSTTGAELGNKVSMELFGIRKFTEQNYVPISVASNFIATTMEKRAADTAKLKNRSFTKRTTRDANAAIYVRSLTDIAVDHMQEMSLYNAMTIPIENLTRVFNYQLPTQEEYDKEGNLIKTTGNSFKEIFEAIYGERGLKYLQDFLKDLNGGNQTTARDFTAGMMSRFKKSAVYGSLSVAIQQPSAVVRACAFVDAKYFAPKPYSTKDYEEMIRYNPVVGIKEIGRFDTGLGQTATEWILDEKGGALKKVDDILSFLPGMMDRMTWVYIWNAVKRETAHNTGLKGEALLTKAAERFRDVIDYTQVYDSTLSRSAMMRDKGTGARMVTMFLSEPTLSYNMVRDGIVNAKAAPKQAAKSLSAFVGATLLNAILKSIITAIRKDDEETNYFEVYATQVVSNFIDDINIFNSLPVIKDIMNILSGYDVERPDMTLFSNLYNAAKVLNKEGHTPTWDEILAFLGAASAVTPIPLNNVIKDVTGIIKTAGGIFTSPDFSPDMLGYAFRDMFIGEQDDSVKLYRAVIAGQTDVIERYRQYDEKNVQKYIKEGYLESDAIAKAMATAENNFHNKVIEGLITEDIRIQEAAEALQGFEYEVYEELIDELTALGFDKNDVIKAINKYIESLKEKEYTESEDTVLLLYDYKDLFRAIDAEDDDAIDAIYTYLRDNGKKQDSIQEAIRNEYAEDVYEAVVSKDKEAYKKHKEIFDRFYYSMDKVEIYALTKYDETVKKAAEARLSFDYGTYEAYTKELVENGFSESNVYSAIESVVNGLIPDDVEDDTEIKDPETSTFVEYKDLHRAIEAENLDAVERTCAILKDAGKKDGYIKNSLAGRFKKVYIEYCADGNDSGMQRLKELLKACDVGFTNADFSDWEKEYLKNK